MSNSTECYLLTIASLVLCITMNSSLPAPQNQDDIVKLSKIYDSLQLLQKKRSLFSSPSIKDPLTSSFNNRENSEDMGLFLAFGEPIRVSNGNSGEGQALQKRQGVWNYDYGLGGGRFGKRGYGDYSLGGGRFGRDVDHVDPDFDED